MQGVCQESVGPVGEPGHQMHPIFSTAEVTVVKDKL